MFLTSADQFGRQGASRDFLTRRLIRIVPIYWLFTSLTVVAVAAGLMKLANLDPGHVVASYAFFPWPRPGDGNLNPVLGLGWTLNYEMLFYVLFSLALMLPKRIGVVALVGALVGLALLHPLVPKWMFALYFWSEPIVLEFLVGMGIAALYRRGVRISPWIGVPLAIAMIFIPPSGADVRFLSWGLPAAVIVACAVLTPDLPSSRVQRLLSLLGGASYALYLSHPFTVNVIGIAMRKIGLSAALPYIAIAALASVAASVVVHLLIEKPASRLLRRQFRT
jgi:peptidoglycan/LPS O-acetylase OafA/YrhL